MADVYRNGLLFSGVFFMWISLIRYFGWAVLAFSLRYCTRVAKRMQGGVEANTVLLCSFSRLRVDLIYM